MQHVVPGGKPPRTLVNAVGLNQPAKRLRGDAEPGYGMLQSHGNGMRRLSIIGQFQFRFPPVQPFQPTPGKVGAQPAGVGRRAGRVVGISFVAQVVHRAAPSIDGIDMGAFVLGRNPTAHIKVFVMATSQAGAVRLRLGQCRRPGCAPAGVRRGLGS